MTQSNKKIAITGGIGSGKSEVCKIIENTFPVFSCDKIYAGLLSKGAFDKALLSAFGEKIFTCGRVDKVKLSALVFGNNEALKKLNAITHPAIMQAAFEQMGEHKLSFLEVPLLFENGFESLFDGVIVVLREKLSRISAAAKRDNLSPESVTKRINSQYNYENNNFAKYYVIHNDGNLDDLRQKTLEILNKIEV